MNRNMPRITLRPGQDVPTAESFFSPLKRQGAAPILPALASLFAGGARFLAAIARGTAGGAQLAERLAGASARTAASMTPVALTAAPGEVVRYDFVVNNNRAIPVSGKLTSTDWYSDRDVRPGVSVVHFRPDSVDIPPGGFQPVTVEIRIDGHVAHDATYHATVLVAGSPILQLPIQLHMSHSRT